MKKLNRKELVVFYTYTEGFFRVLGLEIIYDENKEQFEWLNINETIKITKKELKNMTKLNYPSQLMEKYINNIVYYLGNHKYAIPVKIKPNSYKKLLKLLKGTKGVFGEIEVTPEEVIRSLEAVKYITTLLKEDYNIKNKLYIKAVTTIIKKELIQNLNFARYEDIVRSSRKREREWDKLKEEETEIRRQHGYTDLEMCNFIDCEVVI